MTRHLRLLLVDDHHIVRLGLRALLGAEPDLEVVGEAGAAAQAIEPVSYTHLRAHETVLRSRMPSSA